MQFPNIAGNWTLGKKYMLATKVTLYSVLRDGIECGFVTKIRSTRTETHPWKAFVGKGLNSLFLGVSYGGRDNAILLIAQAYQS